VEYAINYYRDFVKPAKQYRAASDVEKKALKELAETLSGLDADADASAIQTEVYQIGKNHPFEDLKSWFKALYEILLGQSRGPRIGSFIALYGIQESIDLINRAVADEKLGN
jgi:lysyl-tRNA synthetase class 1